jgi:hypothetical protein
MNKVLYNGTRNLNSSIYSNSNNKSNYNKSNYNNSKINRFKNILLTTNNDYIENPYMSSNMHQQVPHQMYNNMHPSSINSIGQSEGAYAPHASQHLSAPVSYPNVSMPMSTADVSSDIYSNMYSNMYPNMQGHMPYMSQQMSMPVDSMQMNGMAQMNGMQINDMAQKNGALMNPMHLNENNKVELHGGNKDFFFSKKPHQKKYFLIKKNTNK